MGATLGLRADTTTTTTPPPPTTPLRRRSRPPYTPPTSLPPRHSPTHHVAHQLPLLRGEVPGDRLLRYGQREADRRDGRLCEAARIRQHRRHDPAVRTVSPTYPIHPETDPCGPQRGGRRAACGQGEGVH